MVNSRAINLSFGKFGEAAAVSFLRNNGYKILKVNYKTKLGEIDIIAKDKDAISFVEVKTRHSQQYGLPFEAVSRDKQRQVMKSALVYLKENNLLHKNARFDVVSVLCVSGKPELDLIKNAFELEEGYAI